MHRVMSFIVGCVLLSVVPGAQVLPDFSGTWTLDERQNGPAVAAGAMIRAPRLVISQTPTEITIDQGVYRQGRRNLH